jgi:hypothetical protein
VFAVVRTWARTLLHRRSEGPEPIRTLFPHYRHDFDAPPEILEQLRVVDPRADLLYLGWGKWLLVVIRPDREHMAAAYRRLDSARRILRLWEANPLYRANPGAFRVLYQRYLYWLAASQGARPIGEYPAAFIRRFGFEAVVLDFRRADWLYRTVTDNQLFDDNDPHGLDFEKARARDEADADLRSEHRALDGYRYLVGRTHAVTRVDDPEKRRQRSGFSLTRSIR